jgi:hypothetical protein
MMRTPHELGRQAWPKGSRYGIARALAVGLVALLASAFAANAATLPQPPAPPAPTAPPRPGGHYAPYDGLVPLTTSAPISAGGCTYTQVNDDPHISSTAPRAASVHGWFNRVGGTCPQADVTAGLQAYWCDMFGCQWITVATGASRVSAGGGSANRATARQVCSSSPIVGWRGWTDVDLVGISDPGGVTYSNIVNLGCAP